MSVEVTRMLKDLVSHIREDIPEEQMSKHLLECVEDAEMYFADEDIEKWEADEVQRTAPSLDEWMHMVLTPRNEPNK